MSKLLAEINIQEYLDIARKISQTLQQNAVERDRIAGQPKLEINLLKQSGLLLFPIPREHGGGGATWQEMYKAVGILAKADGSIGQLYGNHITLIHAPAVIGNPLQAANLYSLTATENLFWANAFNARDNRLQITPEGDNFRVNGIKSFGTGVAIADINLVSAIQPGVENPVVFVLFKDRPGVTYNKDWDNMGQRRTLSGSYIFNNVLIKESEIIGAPPNQTGAFPTLIFLISQLAKTFVYLGIAEGAYETAKEYTTLKTRPWLTSGVERAVDDPFILYHYGEFWTKLQAGIALAERAADKIQLGWEKGLNLTFAERGEIAIAVAAAKSFAIKIGLELTTDIFGVMGARATASKYGFDRYWRDLRTFSLHDPVDYKLHEIGNWILNQVFPTPSPYS